MSEHNSELLNYYREYRIKDQLDFYTGRKERFDRATGQGLTLSATLFGFATAISALAGTTVGWTAVWSAASVIVPAISTALAAFLAIYAFDQQSKIYGDVIQAIRAAARPVPNPASPEAGHTPEKDIADFVTRVEDAFRQENAQWGQLTARIQIPDQAKGATDQADG